MIIPLYTEKAFDKTQHPFMIKFWRDYEYRGLDIIKAVYSKLIASFNLDGEKFKGILKLETRQGYLLCISLHLFNTVLGVLSRAGGLKEIRGWKLERKSQSIFI